MENVHNKYELPNLNELIVLSVHIIELMQNLFSPSI